MRTLKILLVLAAVIFSGFSKGPREIKPKTTVPVKFEGVIITNPSEQTVCTPTGDGYPFISHSRTGWLKGQQSHGGKLISDQSTWTIANCDTDFSTMINTAYIEGLNTVANGDSYSYRGAMLTDITNMHATLYITVTGGTGMYEGATGNITLTGVYSESGIPVTGWGSVSFSR